MSAATDTKRSTGDGAPPGDGALLLLAAGGASGAAAGGGASGALRPRTRMLRRCAGGIRSRTSATISATLFSMNSQPLDATSFLPM